ncbi:MAG TPA: hypothetical protein VGM77_06305 [Gemmatimonadales bacterium]|jgi:hypothetical protein
MPSAILVGALVASLFGCDHAAPFAASSRGAAGPRVAGPEALIDGARDSSVWTADGRGIFFTGPCLISQTVRGNVASPAFSIIPAGGGSISWQKCETAISRRLPRDSVAAFWATSLSPGGQLLYLESVSWAPTPVLVFPAFSHADLWLGDSAGPLGGGRRILALYHDSAGASVVSPQTINWLIGVHWVDEQTFVAIGANLPTRLGVIHPTLIQLVRGTIASNAASLTPIDGTTGVVHYALAQQGATIVFNRGGLAIESIPTKGGAVMTVATLPAAIGQTLADISCRGTSCLLLTREEVDGQVQSTFWTLSLASATLAAVRTDAAAYISAKLSPVSGAVLVGEAGSLFLFTDLLPQAGIF